MTDTLKRFQAELDVLGVDGAIISSPLSVRYLSGFDYTDGYLLILRERAYMLADFRYIEAAQKYADSFEVVMPESDMLSELSLLMSINGSKVIAIEDEDITVGQYTRLCEKFSRVTLTTGASEVIRQMRMVKSCAELEKIAAAQRITDAAFEHILGFITPERTEREIALELEFFMRGMGAESVAFDTIAVSGAASSLPHGVPSDKKLSQGFLTMDFGARLDGYCSDMTRTVVIGKADSEMKKVYNTVLSAQLCALEQIREGMMCRDADKIARDVIKNAGYGSCFGHSLGHGVGLYIHESPSLSPKAKDTDILRRGNVVTVEPGIYIAGKYGCRIEDMIAIDHDGALLNFTKSTKELIEL